MNARGRAIAAGNNVYGSGWKPDVIASAPGRLEVLGNHVDYSGGKVIAAAIDRTVIVARSPGTVDGKLEVVFSDFSDSGNQNIDAISLGDWRRNTGAPEPVDYVRGMVAALASRDAYDTAAGVQLAIAGDVPVGLGLSSSAALCVALALALSTKAFEKRDLVLIAQEAENRAGTPCGTMDQSASVAGGFILYDSGAVTFEQLEPDLGDLAFAVADSGVSRSLGSSSYPTRVQESHQGLRLAQSILGRKLPSLADVEVSDLETLSAAPESHVPTTIFRRVRHIVTENQRVRDGNVALEQGDWETFGALMTASGRSSAIDYEISHPRVEELVAQALGVHGVLGARMMGGGEGGTALILVRMASISELERNLAEGYYAEHGMAPGVYVFQTSHGAKRDEFC